MHGKCICQSQSPNFSHRPPFPLVSIHLFSVSLFLLCKEAHLYPFSRFQIYVLICNIGFSLSDLPHSVWRSLGKRTASFSDADCPSAVRPVPSRQSLKEPRCGNSGTGHAYSTGVEVLSLGALFYPLLPFSVLSTLVFFSISALSPVSWQSGSLCRDKTSILFYSFSILSYPILGTGHNTILSLGWKKRKLESRLLGEVSITSDMQMTPPLWQKVKRN